MAAVFQPEKERFWRDKLSRFKKSGLSLPAFSEQEGINRHTFKSWIFIINGRDGEEAIKQLKAKRSSGRQVSQAVKSRRLQQQFGTVQRWKESGLSQAAFCRTEGIREQQLSMWKKQFAIREGHKEVQESFVALKVVEQPNVVQTPSGCGDIGPSAGTTSGDVQPVAVAKLCCGETVVTVFAGADVETLRALFVVLKERWL